MIPVQLTPLEPWIRTKIAIDNEPLSRQELETFQLEKLRQVIHFAREKSRFYARHLVSSPTSLGDLNELCLYPFTTPQDLRTKGSEFVCVSQSEINRVVTLDTSGTTGSPKRVFFTLADQELTIDFFHHGMSTFTKAADRVMILLPCQRPGSVGDLLAIALTRLGAIPLRYGPVRDPQDALLSMQANNVNVIVGAPVNVLTLARFWQASKNAIHCKPEHILLSTDHLTLSIKNFLECTWGCTVFDHYGMTEMGLGGGVECQARQGFHLREADLFFEVVHPITGQPVPDGEIGEVVFTSLTRVGMPLIRYRTGDLSRFIPKPCPCGTILRTLGKIERRISERVAFDNPQETDAADGFNPPTLSIVDLDECLFSIPQLVNFSARVTGVSTQKAGAGYGLEVNLLVFPGTENDIIVRAESALLSIPAIQIARQAGILDFTITFQEFEPRLAGNLSKRMIRDQRGEPHAGHLVGN